MLPIKGIYTCIVQYSQGPSLKCMLHHKKKDNAVCWMRPRLRLMSLAPATPDAGGAPPAVVSTLSFYRVLELLC